MSDKILDSPLEEYDEDRELTNLNWLLRNQNLTWPKTIDGNFEDGDTASTQATMKEYHKDKNNVLHGKQKIFDYAKNDVTQNHSPISKSKRCIETTVPATSLKQPSPAERYEVFVNKIKRDLAEYKKSATKYKTDDSEKPPFNYSHIIGMVMLEKGRVTLQQICAWIESKFAFFRVRKKWNNSIRHNLSLHHCFRNRKREEKGKGGYWELGMDPKKCEKKRIRNRKTSQRKLDITKKLGKDVSQRKNPKILYRRRSELSQAENKMLLNVDEDQALTLPDADTDACVAFPNVMSASTDIDHCPEEQALANVEVLHPLQQQFELGTIIISRTGIIDESTCLNSFITNKFSCSNMIYTEDEIPVSSENVIISSHMSTFDTIDVCSEPLAVPVISNPEIPRSVTINCNYSNYRPCMDLIEDPFSFLQSSEVNRNEDILDNLLDICVRDY